MKIFKESILAAIMLLSSTSLHAETRTFDIGDIHSIDIGVGLSLFYTQGPLKKMEISANDDAFDFIKCTNNKGILTIQYVPSHKNSNSDVIIYVQAPNLVYFRASTGSRITLRNDFECKDELTLVARVGSSITAADIRAKSIKAYISTGSDLTASDLYSDNINIHMSAGDNVNINKVAATEFSINSGSGGSAQIGNFNGSTLHATSGSGSTFKLDNITTDMANLQLYAASSMSIPYINAYNINANMNTSTTLDIAGLCNTANMTLADKVTTTLNIKNLSGSKNINYRYSNINLPNSSKGKVIINGKEYPGRYKSYEDSQSNSMKTNSSKGTIIINGKEYSGEYNSSGNQQQDSRKKKQRQKQNTREKYRFKDLNP